MGWLGEERVQREIERAPGPEAQGAESGFVEVARAAMRSAWYVDNSNAVAAALEAAYDKQNDAIFTATGQRLANPMRSRATGAIPRRLVLQPDDDPEARPRLGVDRADDPFAAWELQRSLLAERHPDKLDAIKPGEPVIDVARQLKVDSERAASSALARYRGPWGTGTIASLAGGFLGQFNDPINVGLLFAGPTGRAGDGLKGLAWMAAKQGAANATAEAAIQPLVAEWRRDGGPAFDVGYDATTFATNVGTAAAFGAGVDLAVRGSIRAVQGGLRGRVPVLDEQGGVMGWETREAALDRAARASRNETLRAAADLDEGALRTLTKETPLATDPEMRAIWEAYDDLQAAAKRAPGVPEAVDDAAQAQAARHLIDPAHEPPPAPTRPEPVLLFRAAPTDETPAGVWLRSIDDAMAGGSRVQVVAVPADRAGEIKGLDVGAGVEAPADLAGGAMFVDRDLLRLRERLLDGDMNDQEMAATMRDHPWMLAGLELDTATLREAHAVARLSDAAFDMVMDGDAPPEWGALVAQLVADAPRQAGVLRRLVELDPETAADARMAIGVLAADGGAPRIVADGAGIDDVHGTDGQRQVEALERQLGLAPAADPTAQAGAVGGPPRSAVRQPETSLSEADASGGAVGSFITAKGSRYIVHEDGTTTRDKAPRADVGHEGDSGVKPRSERTYYIDEREQGRLGAPQGQWRVIDHGDGTLSVATRPSDDARWGISPSAKNVPVYSRPSVGLVPIELWKKETIYSRDAYRAVHFGNPIREMGAPAIVVDPQPVVTAMAHPAHADITLPVNADGTVSFWRLGRPGKDQKGSTWTSSRAQVEAYAQRAPGLEIVRLDMKVDDLAEAVPMTAGRADETLFTIPYETARGDAVVLGEIRPSAAEVAAERATLADLRRAREPNAGQQVDASGAPATPRSPPTGAGRQVAQSTAASTRTFTGPARKVMTAMRRDGVDGVEAAFREMGPAGVREAAARLAGDMGRTFHEMAPRAQAALLGARVLKAMAGEMDGLKGGGAGELRTLAAALEAKALAGDVGEAGLGRAATDQERVVVAMERRGKIAVEQELLRMGPAAARELAETWLPGEKLRDWAELTPGQQADRIGRAILAGRMALTEGRRHSIEGRAMRAMIEATGEDVSIRSNLDDAEAIERLAELIRECKL